MHFDTILSLASNLIVKNEYRLLGLLSLDYLVEFISISSAILEKSHCRLAICSIFLFPPGFRHFHDFWTALFYKFSRKSHISSNDSSTLQVQAANRNHKDSNEEIVYNNWWIFQTLGDSHAHCQVKIGSETCISQSFICLKDLRGIWFLFFDCQKDSRHSQCCNLVKNSPNLLNNCLHNAQ